jgi:hypothetical protein
MIRSCSAGRSSSCTSPAATLQTGPFAWNGAVAFWMIAGSYGSWVLVMSWVMLKVVDRAETDGELSLATSTTDDVRLEALAAEVAALREEVRLSARL